MRRAKEFRVLDPRAGQNFGLIIKIKLIFDF